MSRDFDLNLLPVLVAIHEHGSVTAAAQHLGMSQSAVSTALARLRQKYGDPLFQRVGHGMKATARMRALIRPLREALIAGGRHAGLGVGVQAGVHAAHVHLWHVRPR